MSSEALLLNTLRATARNPREAEEVIQAQIHIKSSTANFFSIYRYATAWQLCGLFISACCSIAAGVAMPMMTVGCADAL